MRHSSQDHPNSNLQANAAEKLAISSEQREPLAMTQSGEAEAGLQYVEEPQNALAVLKILAHGIRM